MNTFRSYLTPNPFPIVLACLAIHGVAVSGAELIPVPDGGGNGDTWSHVPFSGLTLSDVPPIRMQQAYDAGSFSSIPDGGWITGIWFVSDPDVGRNWTASLPRVEFTMSVTDRSVDALSTIFDENVGMSSVSVRPLGPLSLTSVDKGSVVQVDFQTPFLYYPSAGNLLMEIKNWDPTCCPGVPQLNAGPLDAWNIVGDPVSRVYAIGDANARTGTADTLGLTTYFMVTPIPEPSTTVLLGAGFFALGWSWLRRRKHTEKR